MPLLQQHRLSFVQLRLQALQITLQDCQSRQRLVEGQAERLVLLCELRNLLAEKNVRCVFSRLSVEVALFNLNSTLRFRRRSDVTANRPFVSVECSPADPRAVSWCAAGWIHEWTRTSDAPKRDRCESPYAHEARTSLRIFSSSCRISRSWSSSMRRRYFSFISFSLQGKVDQ